MTDRSFRPAARRSAGNVPVGLRRAATVLLLVLAVSALHVVETPRASDPSAKTLPLTLKEKRGRKVFAANCQTCHPGGRRGVGPSLVAKPLSAALIKASVRHGKRGMPAYSVARISNRQLDDIVAYIKALRRR